MLRPILIVDADRDNRAILVAYLRFHGYTTLEAVTGEDALRMVRDHHPVTVITELVLPKLDGCSLLRTVKGDPATRHVPVLVVTADALPQARERAVAAGCDLFLLKPFDLQQLLEAVLLLVSGRDRAAVS